MSLCVLSESTHTFCLAYWELYISLHNALHPQRILISNEDTVNKSWNFFLHLACPIFVADKRSRFAVPDKITKETIKQIDVFSVG